VIIYGEPVKFLSAPASELATPSIAANGPLEAGCGSCGELATRLGWTSTTLVAALDLAFCTIRMLWFWWLCFAGVAGESTAPSLFADRCAEVGEGAGGCDAGGRFSVVVAARGSALSGTIVPSGRTDTTFTFLTSVGAGARVASAFS
jgi:hypothetical protein